MRCAWPHSPCVREALANGVCLCVIHEGDLGQHGKAFLHKFGIRAWLERELRRSNPTPAALARR